MQEWFLELIVLSGLEYLHNRSGKFLAMQEMILDRLSSQVHSSFVGARMILPSRSNGEWTLAIAT